MNNIHINIKYLTAKSNSIVIKSFLLIKIPNVVTAESL